jgi:hypothetical protein
VSSAALAGVAPAGRATGPDSAGAVTVSGETAGRSAALAGAWALTATMTAEKGPSRITSHSGGRVSSGGRAAAIVSPRAPVGGRLLWETR